MDFDEIKEESGKCEASYYYATVDEDGASGGGTTSSSPDVSLSYLPAPPEELFNDEEQFPSAQQFNAIVQEYLDNLSTKKRDKALVDRQRYELILQVLRDPRNTAVSTAQFRFWVKKMFELVRIDQQDIVCHDGKPVAMREQIYEILVSAHRDAHHGGRDKTASLVRKSYSWIPKELVARFVRHCPFCVTRRTGCQSPIMGYDMIIDDNNASTTPPLGMQDHHHQTLSSMMDQYYYCQPEFPLQDRHAWSPLEQQHSWLSPHQPQKQHCSEMATVENNNNNTYYYYYYPEDFYPYRHQPAWFNCLQQQQQGNMDYYYVKSEEYSNHSFLAGPSSSSAPFTCSAPSAAVPEVCPYDGSSVATAAAAAAVAANNGGGRIMLSRFQEPLDHQNDFFNPYCTLSPSSGQGDQCSDVLPSSPTSSSSSSLSSLSSPPNQQDNSSIMPSTYASSVHSCSTQPEIYAPPSSSASSSSLSFDILSV